MLNLKGVKVIIACCLIQAFMVFNVCFASAEASGWERESDCLSPRLKIQTDGLFQAYTILSERGIVSKTADVQHKKNGYYTLLLRKLIKQVGTAEELLKNIKEMYADEFAEPVNALEQIEEEYALYNGEWVIEHQKEVMLMSYCMGKILGFNNHRLARLAIAARFHDIGKCEVNPEVINDKRFFANEIILTREDREAIHREIIKHVERSYNVLKAVGIKDELVLAIVFCHHANVDGSGYPVPITRQEIPLEAKITRVVDSFSAMLGRRPYPRPYQQSFQGAVQEIENNVYFFYGPRVVKAFLSMLRDEKITNRRDEFYYIPLYEDKIFVDLLREVKKIDFVYPFAKVSCGISNNWNEKPYSIATNSIGAHRHAEVNLVLKVLDENLRRQGLSKQYMRQLRRLEFLAYTTNLEESEEALEILGELLQVTNNPFKNKVVYTTLRPCAACFKLLNVVGVKEIYYGLEHPDPGFIRKSEKAARELRQNGIKVARAHSPNEGVIEPNRLFFAFCIQPGYKKISETTNSWFAEIINHNDMQKLPIDIMKKKAREFVNMIDNLLGDLDAESDLEQVNDTLRRTKNIMRYAGVKECREEASLENYNFIEQAI